MSTESGEWTVASGESRPKSEPIISCDETVERGLGNSQFLHIEFFVDSTSQYMIVSDLHLGSSQ